MTFRGFIAIILAFASAPALSAEREARSMFGAEKTGSPHRSASFGGYSKGCLSGAEQLSETGPTWQSMRLSRNRNRAHPEMIDFVKRLSQKAAKEKGWGGLYVGDMSQPRGGPMTSGHRSHQIGLDADIWLQPMPAGRLTSGCCPQQTYSFPEINAKTFRRFLCARIMARMSIQAGPRPITTF